MINTAKPDRSEAIDANLIRWAILYLRTGRSAEALRILEGNAWRRAGSASFRFKVPIDRRLTAAETASD